jgi:hypothetical protein
MFLGKEQNCKPEQHQAATQHLHHMYDLPKKPKLTPSGTPGIALHTSPWAITKRNKH